MILNDLEDPEESLKVPNNVSSLLLKSVTQVKVYSFQRSLMEFNRFCQFKTNFSKIQIKVIKVYMQSIKMRGQIQIMLYIMQNYLS